MLRVRLTAGFVCVSFGLTGCAGFWDTVTSRKFRDSPFGTMRRMVSPDDPLEVLRTSGDGGERAKAMLRLKEPLKAGGTQEDQDEAVEILSKAATADTSPVLRMAAITALGKFEDARAPGVLIAAYSRAHGRTESQPAAPADGVVPAAGRRRDPLADRLSLTGPTGYPPDTVAAIRGKALESLGRTQKPEAARFLAQVAAGPAAGEATALDGSEDREVRLAAVRGLGACRQPEAVHALARVLTQETGKDGALVGRAHDGLVKLTGKRLPADAQQWNEVVQAGVQIAPEPTAVGAAVQNAIGWAKP